MSNPEWTPPMDTDESKDYGIDWSPVLTPRGDVIAESTWGLTAAAAAAGLVISGDRHDDLTTTVWLTMASGVGKAGKYGVANTIVTSGERRYQQVRMLSVIDNGYRGIV